MPSSLPLKCKNQELAIDGQVALPSPPLLVHHSACGRQDHQGPSLSPLRDQMTPTVANADSTHCSPRSLATPHAPSPYHTRSSRRRACRPSQECGAPLAAQRASAAPSLHSLHCVACASTEATGRFPQHLVAPSCMIACVACTPLYSPHPRTQGSCFQPLIPPREDPLFQFD